MAVSVVVKGKLLRALFTEQEAAARLARARQCLPALPYPNHAWR